MYFVQTNIWSWKMGWSIKIAIVVLCFCQLVLSHDLSEAETLAFEAPNAIKKGFPYYLSGYNEDGLPIWIFEMGKWDYRKVVEEGGENFDALDIYVDQMFLTFRKSGLNSTDKHFVCICDLDEFDFRQAGHVKTVQFIITKFVTLEKIIRDGAMKQAWIVNGNALWQGVWRLGKQILGSLADSIESYGTNKEVWIPKLLKQLPRDQLPEWYGGLPNHKPVKIYG